MLNNIKKIRHYFIGCLIFSLLLPGCSDDKRSGAISVEWKDGHARGIIIPWNLLADIPEESIEKELHVRVAKDSTQTDILGNFDKSDTAVIFHPLISLTRGLKYEVRSARKLLGEIDIPAADAHNAPLIVAVYPTRDTVPENLLKFYIQFSKPMQEGKSLEHIVLLKNGHDTAKNVFLDLQPELWNNNRTMLTLWLDPGRIKRDLQPNKQMGPPLQPGVHYQLIITGWQDTEGSSLTKPYQKDFITGIRDSISPGIDNWIITFPNKGSLEPLIIDLRESLDYVLLNNTIRIIDGTGNIVRGKIAVKEKERILHFIPASAWKPGTYTLEVESRLEDLAGNNLNRLFDTDLAGKQTEDQSPMHKKEFRIL